MIFAILLIFLFKINSFLQTILLIIKYNDLSKFLTSLLIEKKSINTKSSQKFINKHVRITNNYVYSFYLIFIVIYLTSFPSVIVLNILWPKVQHTDN